MVAGLQRAEFSDPLATQDDEDELDLSLGLSIGGGNKRKAEIDFLSGSFPVVRSATRTPNTNPIPAMPLYLPPPYRIFPPASALVNPNPSSNLNLNVTPNPNHGENGEKRRVRMKRTPSYSGSLMSSSSGPIRGRSSSSSETRSHSDPYVADQKPNKQSIQEVVSKPTAQAAAAAAEKVDRMPCVMTMGRDGNTVNGVLYRYNEREVSIVCVCHGTPFSPEGFVRHAGGMESSNPLRQIVVVPS